MADMPDAALPGQTAGTAAITRFGGLRQLAGHPRLLQAAVAATLALTPAFFYARAIGDGLLSLVALMFLARSWAARDWNWARAPHIRLSLIFWVWLVFCTIVAGSPHALGEAVTSVRFFLLVAALEFWVLANPRQRRQLFYVILAAAVWTVFETWHQDLFGTDFAGNARWGSGVLTGPFQRARAGATLQTLFFIAFLPPAMNLLDRPGIRLRLAGALLLTGAVLTMALIGQRMPMILVVAGLCLTGLVVRRTRGPIALALLALVLAVAAARVISPVTYDTLVVVFLRRMEHFWSTPYALLYQRALVMVQMHPWLGLGYDGFRNYCNDPRYFRPLSWLPVTDIGDPAGCTIHPHNYWLQVATSTGLPGTALFIGLSVLWLAGVGRGVFRATARPIQVALLVTLCTELWPIASTTSMFTVPNAGWIFLFIGWGLAEQRAAPSFPVVAKQC